MMKAYRSDLYYDCCFCGLPVDPVPPDVCDLHYSLCERNGEISSISGSFNCHVQCLLERLHPSMKHYVTETVEVVNAR